MLRIVTSFVVVFALSTAALAAEVKDPKAAETPAKVPAKAPEKAPAEKKEFHLSSMIVKDIKTIDSFICGEAETNFEGMMEALGKTFFPLMEKEGENGTVFDYPAIFVYHGNTGDPTKPTFPR